MDTRTAYTNPYEANQATVPMSGAPAPQPTGYVPAGAYPEPAPRRGAPVLLVVAIGALLLLALGGLGIVAVGWFAFDRAVSSIPTAQIGPIVTQSSAIPRGSAQSVHVDLQMGVGTLNLDSSAQSANLFNGDFTYNVPDWKPQVSYSDGTGTLKIHQPGSQGFVKGHLDQKNQWDLHLNGDVPTSLTAAMGAGESTLNLGGMNLTNLDVSTGAANLTVNLAGKWTHDLQAEIQGGVGNTVIIIPKETGVRITAEGGLGGVESNGLARKGNTYTNAAYGKSDTTLNINVQMGVGNVTLLEK